MIRAIVIDDEARVRQLLIQLIETELKDRVEVVDSADDISSGFEAIEKHKPDLVFLDIQMHEGTGFDLLKQFDKVDFEIVFVTAFNEYAIQAIEFSAFGYIMKPIKVQELRNVVTRLEDHFNDLKKMVNNRVKILIENYEDGQKIKKLIINQINGFDVTLVRDIIRLEGDRNYTNFILTNDRKILTSKTLGEYEELLFNHGFYRIHQSTIVNLRHITKYKKGVGGKVIMSDGESFNVSRYRKAGFIKHFLGED